MKPTVKSMYEQTVSNYSNKEGFVDRRLGKRWTYKEWDEEVNKLAHAFQMADVKKGDRVSTILFNTAEFALTLFACMKIGAIFNPINFRLTEKEIDFILKDASPKIVIVESLTIPQVEKVRNHLEDTEFWSIDANLSYPSFYEKMKIASSDQPFCEVTEERLLCRNVYIRYDRITERSSTYPSKYGGSMSGHCGLYRYN